MKKSELRVAVQEMDTYQFGLKNELHNKLTKVTSYVPKKEVIDLIDQLEEPEQEKVVVPQFVADRIEEYREIRFGLSLIFTIDDQTEDDIDFSKWLSADSENCEKVARAWLDGYTVEKEKLYYLKLPNNGYFGELTDEDYFERTIRKERAIKFTEQEIKAIDERYLAFKEEITK